jgi:hypothetical protein
MLKKIPFHPLLLAVYPTLTLLGSNIEEVDLQVAVRALLISLTAAMMLWGVLQLILRNWSKSALVTSFLLALFFSYGHVYGFLEANPIAGFNLGRHRYLVLLYGAVLVVGLWWLIFRVKNTTQTVFPMNLISMVVLIFPLIQIGGFEFRTASQQKQVEQLLQTNEPALEPTLQPLPDIYYIVLDSHTRQDALLEDYQFDNSPYLEELRSLGFYIADCARSNYGYTQGSIVSALNLDYLPDLGSYLSATQEGEDIWILLKQSRVRRQLEALGYQTVAFDTGYEWSRLTDADVYLSLGNDSAGMQRINPFEAMLVKSTALLLLTDTQNQLLRSRFAEVDFPYSFHVNSQRFILDQLPRLADDPQPQFVFVHLLVPHVPFVFDENGEVVSDPAFYDGKKSWPSDDEHLRQGYTNEVAFIDQAMVDSFRTILAESETPPIVVLMGDHGLRSDNRYKILNAYYLPEDGSEKLYPAITPVNSFRLIFDTYFGSNYGLTHDTSYTDEGEVVPETSPACLQP